MDKATVFRAVHEVYAEQGEGPLTNRQLYKRVAEKIGASNEEFAKKKPIGKSGAPHSPMERTARWTQQTMRMRGLLQRVDDKRGLWSLTSEGKRRLHRIHRGQVMVAFSTKLGCALWADNRDAFARLDEPIQLCLTSPPYALAKPRDYGNCSQAEWVDWLSASMEPVVRRLARGGSICLNIGNSIFIPGTPARTLLIERLTIALCDRFGLFKMDMLPWENPSSPPGPVAWSSLKRVQLNATYEAVLWLTSDPMQVKSDNRRVLLPHTEKHLRLIAKGGEHLHQVSADGAHVRRPGAFGNPTPGRIPRNILKFSSVCGSQRVYKAAARSLGLPAHGAPFPLALCEFLIKFLTEEGDLVVDNFGGSLTTALAAERLGRRWLTVECMAEYVAGGATRFPEIEFLNPALQQLLSLPIGRQLQLPLLSV